MPMVSWQSFVAIAFDVAEDKGIEFAGINDGASFMSDLGDLWSQEKQRYKQMTKQQTYNDLEEMVQ